MGAVPDDENMNNCNMMTPSFLPVGRSLSALTNLVSRDLGNEEDVRGCVRVRYWAIKDLGLARQGRSVQAQPGRSARN